MTLTKKQFISIIFLLALVFAMPVAILLTQKRQDIRPKALQGKANFLLSPDSTTSSVGKNINVLVSLQVTDDYVRVSGVDFVLLYDKEKLDVGDIVPAITKLNPGAPFTDAPIVTSGGSFDDTYNFVRVAQVARKPTDQLFGGTFSLAKITFRGRGEGQASIKFAEDKYLEIVGIVTDKKWGPTPVDPAKSGDVLLSVVPSSATFAAGESKAFELQAAFSSGSATQKLDYFKAEISFNKEVLQMPAGSYVDTQISGFDKIFRVDGPTAANEAGKIIIELGAKTAGSGPSTEKTITIAKFNLKAKEVVSAAQTFTVGNAQVVDNKPNSLKVSY